jgi:hypothetical protein
MKRTAQAKKSLRITGRFAPQSEALRELNELRAPVQFGGNPSVRRIQ